MLLGEVGDTNGTSLGLGELGHGLPGIDDGNLAVELNLAICGGEKVVASSKSDGPVNEVQLEAIVNYFFD